MDGFFIHIELVVLTDVAEVFPFPKMIPWKCKRFMKRR